MNEHKDITREQSFFAIFCIEKVALKLGISGSYVYDKLAVESNILDEYIIEHYDVLHTQGEEWIVEDLIEFMKEKGVL